MELKPGARLGPYEILSRIGEGGMGQVWKARDTRLDRIVAIKTSAARFSERFEREARAVAALNHPHICTLYDVGPDYLVMEYVDGEETKGPLPLDQALKYAIQLASALEAAHKKLITHRDLKPANILIAKSGVKVLDFGLAKTGQTPEAKASEETLTRALTQEGAIVGTLQYMAPEQLQGRATDVRADIFSFGCVLYEMIQGKRAFDGANSASVIAAILERPAPSVEGVAPASLDWLLGRCLAKDPDERWQTARDLRAALERVAEVATEAQRTRVTPLVLALSWGIAAAALLAVMSFVYFRRSPEPAPAPRQVLTIVPPSGTNLRAPGSDSYPAISPDGSAILEHELLRRLDSLGMMPLRGTEGMTNQAFWTLDSKSIVFPVGSVLKKMRVPDGAPENIAKLPAPTRGGSLSDNGTMLISSLNSTGSLYMVPPGGDSLVPVEVPRLKQGQYRWPEFLPGSNDFLFFLETPEMEEGEVYMATLRDGKATDPVMLLRNGTSAHFTPAGGGRILFVRNDNLYSQKLDRNKRKTEGDPQLIVQGVASSSTVASFSVSRAGTVAWRPGKAALAQWTTFDRTGKNIGVTGPPGGYNSVSLSPDESHLLTDHWLMESERPGRLRLDSGNGTWFPDGLHLLGFSAGALFERPLNDAEPPVKLAEVPGGFFLIQDVSPDGKIALLSDNADLYSVRLDGPAAERTLKPAIRAGEMIVNAGFSPDGHWVVYRTYSTPGLFVQPFPGAGLRKQISSRGRYPVWRRDGKEIIYLDQSQIWSIRVESIGSQLRFSAPVALFRVSVPASLVAREHPLAITRDGSRIYFPLPVEQPDNNMIHVMSGWLKP